MGFVDNVVAMRNWQLNLCALRDEVIQGLSHEEAMLDDKQ